MHHTYFRRVFSYRNKPEQSLSPLHSGVGRGMPSDTMPLDHDRFVKLMMLASSPIDAEALNALRCANRMLEKEGKVWSEVLKPEAAQKQEPQQPKQSPWGSSPWEKAGFYAPFTNEAEIDAAFAAIERRGVSGSAGDFVDSLWDQWDKRGRLSAKQRQALWRFYENAR